LTDRAGCLYATGTADNARLQTLLARVLPGAGAPRVGGSTTVPRSSGLPSGLPRLAVHVTPVSVAGKELGASAVAVLVIIIDPAATPRIDAERLRTTLGLTQAEQVGGGTGARHVREGCRRRHGSGGEFCALADQADPPS